MKIFNSDNYFVLLFCAMLFMIFSFASIDSYLSYLNKKQIIEMVKSDNSKWSAEQLQGLINSRN